MALNRARKTSYPQLPQAPDDYPVFPDVSTWPVVFPELPPNTNGRFARPPQHPSKAVAPQIPADQVPNHVAVVMDGNGRWATQRGLGRTEGHKMGEAVLIDITCGAIELGIKHLSVYAFSTENWKRSTEEVRFLMGFNREVVRRRRENLNAMGVNMRWVGSRPRMWSSVIKEFDIAEQMTVGNDVITVNYCVNYGGRTEIVEAARELAEQAVAGKINPTCTAPTFPTWTCSSAPRANSAPATSCCGRRRTPSTSSRTNSGRTTTAATCGPRARNTSTATVDLAEPNNVPEWEGLMSDLLQRLAAVLADSVTIVEENDGALTVAHDGTVASLRVVNIGEGLDLVSLTQPLAWDIKLDNKVRDRVADHAGRTMLGSVVLVERAGDPRSNGAKKVGDVMLRYNFPAAGLTDDALSTLVMLVLSTGVDVRADLTS